MLFLVFSIFFVKNVYSQKDTIGSEPFFIVVRTLHGVDGSDINEWKEVAEEYFNKVTSKNDLVVSQEVLLSYFSSNLGEVKLINVYKSWEDILGSTIVRDELIQQAWPDENERKAFFEKQNSFYTNLHSDEIYTSTKLGKYLSPEMKKANKNPFVYYEKINILSDYEQEDSNDLYEEYVKNVIHKNTLIRAYHPYRHYWGADSREFIEVIVVNSIIDLGDALKKNDELLELLVPDKAKRKEFMKIYDKAVLVQADKIYKNVPSLSK